jgi:radical SAM protein with 4Fe4S-binding SPASM domain
MNRFTLHIRLTKRCNAACDYCSSWQEEAIPYMREPQFRAAMEFIAGEVLPRLGYGNGKPAHAAIQYVGGEIMTIPSPHLRKLVLNAREILGGVFTTLVDGVQSNLIGPPRRVKALQTLFGSRIGTSVDHFSRLRKLGGSPELYRAAAAKSRKELREKRGYNPASIFVVDRVGLSHLDQEAALAEESGYDLTLRPVFQGGSAVQAGSARELTESFSALFDKWAMKGSIRIEPFHQLLAGRVGTALRDSGYRSVHAGCPFQKDCAFVSLDLEPNGDLYVCLDMADSGQECLGNAVEGRFNWEVWERLAARKEHYDSKCRACPFLADCQGGCMSEALHATGSPYGRTELCEVWTELFTRIDDLIAREGAAAVRAWLDSIPESGRRAA